MEAKIKSYSKWAGFHIPTIDHMFVGLDTLRHSEIVHEFDGTKSSRFSILKPKHFHVYNATESFKIFRNSFWSRLSC